MADAIFSDPRLAQVYDPLDPDRRDLDAYEAIVDELGARSVLDIGCGTGTFACLLARRGIDVTAVDPAQASLDVARAKPGADAVHWLHGDATSLPVLRVDAAFMTANVAQVFLTDDEWRATLRATRRALRPGGTLVFETRDPARRAWEEWTPALSHRTVDVPGIGVVESWEDVTDVAGDLVTFTSMTAFRRDGVVLESTSTLRFRSRREIEDSLTEEGFVLTEVRGAPDRPSRELVFVANRPGPWHPRRATPDDAVEVARLLHDFNTEFATPSPGVDVLAARLRSLLAGDDTLAILAGAPAVAVALVTLRPNVWYAGPVALLDELYVEPVRRGDGIGSAIIDELLTIARSCGVDLIEINVDEGDVDARRFYERHGFAATEPGSTERALYYSRELGG
jgi:SAM-dependent methyltransferase